VAVLEYANIINENNIVKNAEVLKYANIINENNIVKNAEVLPYVKQNIVKQPVFQNIMVIVYLVAFKCVLKLKCPEITKQRKKLYIIFFYLKQTKIETV